MTEDKPLTVEECWEAVERFAGVCIGHSPPIDPDGCPHCRHMAAVRAYGLAVLDEVYEEENNFVHPRGHDCELCRRYWCLHDRLEAQGQERLDHGPT